MAILTLVIAPDPKLKQISAPVASVTSEIRQLMDDMLDTMYFEKGAGLAAVQVGVMLRVIVIDIENDDGKRYLLKMANPIIVAKSTDVCIHNEGCLSFPEQRIEIARAREVTVNYIDYDNKPATIIADEWLATALQHEIDHLDGKLLVDYASKLKRSLMNDRARKFKLMKMKKPV